MDTITTKLQPMYRWIAELPYRVWCQRLLAYARRAFTTHPHEAGETYLQHLWFTFTMSARFVYVTVVLLLHGIFPFIFVRSASSQIETVYRIMKSRIPKARRAEIDSNDDHDYCV